LVLRGEVSQSIGAEIAGVSRAEFIDASRSVIDRSSSLAGRWDRTAFVSLAPQVEYLT
jgi:hypothetical protein